MKRHRHEKDRIVPTRPAEPAPAAEPAPPAESEADPAPGRPISLVWWLALVVWLGAFLVLWGTELLGLVYRALMGS